MRIRTVAALLGLAAGASSLAAPFTPGNIVVSQMGDGSAALGSTATAVFLKEYTPGGTLVQTIALPTATVGSNRRFSNSGTATSEGSLTRSADGQFLVLAGYDAAVGTTGVVATTSVNNPRVIARVDSLGSIDTSTALSDAYSANNIRSVTSPDGLQFYTGGTATTGGGVRYASLGANSSIQLSTTITNTRVVNIANGQLYVSAASGTIQGVATVGSGLPTTSGQTITILNGFPTAAGPSSYDYFFANANTVYVADDRATASGGGLQKWTFNGTSWTLVYTMNTGLTAGLRGLTGSVSGNTATFYAVSADTLSKVVSVTDSISQTGSNTTAFSTLVTAATNTAFRGVDFAPTPPATPPSGSGSASPASVNNCGSNSALLTVLVTPGTNPTSTGIVVTANLSAIGLSSNQTFSTQNGTTFTYNALISNSVAGGTYTLPFTIFDAQTRNSSGGLTLTIVATSPTLINSGPSNASVCAGAPVSFSVNASGSSISYQWRKGGVNIPGATSASYSIAAVSGDDAGNYDCVVTGTCGSVTSNTASLTVDTAPFIISPPFNTNVCEGSLASFSISASGSPLNYQWRKNGVDIGGATSATYSIAAATLADAGSYDCVVSNTCGSSTSSAAAFSVNATTAITANPVNAKACDGGNASFSVSAVGSGLTYQWRKNGVDIFGATGSSYSITGVVTGDAGNYDCVASGACGSATSSAATLEVNATTAITGQPSGGSACDGNSVVLSVTAVGKNLTYQWRLNGVDIGGANAASYSASVSGSYDCFVGGECGNATSNAASVTILPLTAITSNPVNAKVCDGNDATFTVGATGSGLTYQWRKDGVNVGGANASSYTTGLPGDYDCVVTGDCGTATSSAATLEVNAITSISSNPAGGSVCTGDTFTFSVSAEGKNLTYQWRKDGNDILGATGASYTIASAAAGDAGAYDCFVGGDCGNATSSAASLSINTAPAITSDPSSSTICDGDAATFSVSASGTPTPTYQWRKNGVNIGGATSATFSIPVATISDAGSYDCVVTNTCGSATSSAATLSVNVGPSITTQPTNQSGAAGSTASFSVVATGSGTLTYQWRKNTVNLVDGGSISGALTSTLNVGPLALGDAGSYDVVVTNACGSVTSTAATLTVTGCVADVDDGSGSGTPDGGVTIDDLLYYLYIFELGSISADVDDGSGTGTLDGGVTIDDLLYFLYRFELGC